jgi:putative ATPase
VTSCWEAFERIGMPEGRFPLAQACLYLATAPKSNSAFAFFDALASVEKEQEADVPNHLKDGNRDKEGFGHGEGYLYPHAYRDHWVAQQYLPDALQGKMFYEPSDQGYERQIRDGVARKREAQLAAMLETGELGLEIGEIYTTSPKNKGKEAWLQRTISQAGQALGQQRERLFVLAAVQRHHLVLDVNAGSGLLTWEAVRHAPEGGVYALAAATTDGEALRQQAERLPELERPFILIGDLTELDTLLTLRGEDDLRFDRILARNPITQLRNVPITELFGPLKSRLAQDGRFCLVQTIPQHGQRLYQLVDWSGETKGLAQKVAQAEETIYADESDPLVNWDEADLQAGLEAAGFTIASHQLDREKGQRRLTKAHLERWFSQPGESSPGTYGQKLLDGGLNAKEVEKVRALYKRQLEEQIVGWETAVAYISATS